MFVLIKQINILTYPGPPCIDIINPLLLKNFDFSSARYTMHDAFYNKMSGIGLRTAQDVFSHQMRYLTSAEHDSSLVLLNYRPFIKKHNSSLSDSF